MFEKDDFVIKMLKYGAEDLSSGGDGITVNDLKEKLEKDGYSFKEPKGNFKLGYILKHAFKQLRSDGKHCLQIESYFNLLEYIELKEARQSSKRAMWAAIIAIALSFCSFIVSIYYSDKSANSPVKLDQTQFNTLQENLTNKTHSQTPKN